MLNIKFSKTLSVGFRQIPLASDQQGAEEDSDEGAYCYGEHRGVPGAADGDATDEDLGADCVTEEVAEEAHETGGCSGGVLRNEIQGLDACQSHRAVDEEADKAQGDVDQGLLQSRSGGDDTRADHPIKQDAEQAEEHTDHVHRSAAAFEYLGRGPAAGKCADGADDVVHGESDLALGCGHNGLFLKIGRSPVTDAVTDHIDGHVGDGDNPQELVLEHIVHEQGLERKLLVS